MGDALHCRLDDEQMLVRAAVLTSLAHLAPAGDERCIMTACMALQDPMCAIRDSAVELLKRVAVKGHERALALVSEMCEHQDPGIRSSAIVTMQHLITEADSKLVS